MVLVPSPYGRGTRVCYELEGELDHRAEHEAGEAMRYVSVVNRYFPAR